MKKQTNKLKPSTIAVRSGTQRSNFNEHSEAIYLTSSFVYKNSEIGAQMFADSKPYVYSRYENPSNTMLENRLASIESSDEDISAISFASGLSAHLALCMTFLRANDEIISSRAIFGSTHRLYDFWLKKFNVKTIFVNGKNNQAFADVITDKTKIIYLESPSNPLNEIIDIKGLAKLIAKVNIKRKNKILLVVDNTFATAICQQPIELGADLITYSATKLLDGHGRVLGGAVVGHKELITPLRVFQRCGGATLSAFNAWVIHKGLETLPLRVEKQNSNAFLLAKFLEKHPLIEKVFYPFLQSHPQMKLAKNQMSGGGVIVSFKIKCKKNNEQKDAWRVIDKLNLFSRTPNMGDTRSTVTHPATTTHSRLSSEDKKTIGISDNLIRLSVGLEDVQNLIDDIEQSLKKYTTSS